MRRVLIFIGFHLSLPLLFKYLKKYLFPFTSLTLSSSSSSSSTTTTITLKIESQQKEEKKKEEKEEKKEEIIITNNNDNNNNNNNNDNKVIIEINESKQEIENKTEIEKKKKKKENEENEVNVVDECSTCMSTASHIDKHIIICDNSEWASKIEKEKGTFPNILYDAISQAKVRLGSTLELKITACNEPNDSPDLVNIFIYPENLKFCISKTNLDEINLFAESILTSVYPDNFQRYEIPWKKLILICIHASRDKRCGRAGPLVLNELKEELLKRNISESEIAVRGSSHIGGHKFAGTLIVYPSGHWYGYVTPKVVPELLNCIVSGSILNRCFRGYSNEEW